MRITVVLLCLSMLLSCAQRNLLFTDDHIFITGTTVIDVDGGTALAEHTVVILDDQIVAVVPDVDIRISEQAQVIRDVAYVMPGLWDMHAHALTDADDAIERILPLFIANGVIGIRDMGSVVPSIQEVRQRLSDNRQLVAPHLYVSGPLLDGAKLPWYGDLPLVLKTPEEVQTKLPELIEQGMDFLKIYD